MPRIPVPETPRRRSHPMKYRPVLIALALAVTGTAPAAAQFAYPGDACPPGSQLYVGPEQELIRQSHAVYCSFKPVATRFPKTFNGGKCPEGSKPFRGAG